MTLAARLAVVFALALCAPAAAATPLRDASGLHVASVKQLNARLLAVSVTTKALPAPAHVDVLLPPRYDAQPRRRWPVFYLLHGTSGGASDWTKTGDAQKVIGDRQVITVMPDIALNDDGGGWCTDWPNGAEKWETFHIRQLVPWVDSNLRTIRSRQGRAIAGLSQGGFCSLSYAARHPDMFGTALGYSGAPDIYYDPEARAGGAAIIGATEFGLDHVPPGTFFGDPVTNGINWAAHDPATLAENLRWTRMYMYWGNGQPGPYDSDPVAGLGGATEIEAAVNQSNVDFQRRLEDLRIGAYFDAYGAGTHTWPYWTRDLRWSIGKVMSGFANPAPTPAQFTYTSADDTYRVYGFRVAMHRAARAFSTLSGVSRHEFSLSGSGSATMLTPRWFTRGKHYAATIAGKTSVVVARKDRRIQLQVPLGTAQTTATVSIRPSA